MYVIMIGAFQTLLFSYQSQGFKHRNIMSVVVICVFQTLLFFMLYFSVSMSLSLPNRSQQLFGPCLFSSAYQHALVPVINIGECRFSASLSSPFLLPHVIPGS